MRAGTIALRCAPTALMVLLVCGRALAAEGSASAVTAPPGEAPARPAEAVSPRLPRIVSIRFVGNEHFSARSLKRDLQTQARKPVDLKVLKADADRIVRRYEDDGYLKATVNVTSEPLPGRTEQELLFTIVEGPRFKLSRLEIVGNTVFSTEELRALVTLERDGYFSKGSFLAGAKRIWEHYGRVGRLTTVVEPEMGPPPLTPEVEVRYVIREGPPVTLQSFSFEWTNPQVTAKWLLYKVADPVLTEGKPLTLGQIEEVVGRLKKNRWFKSVDYQIRPGSAPDRVVVVFLLEEGKTSRLNLTGTAATYFGLSAALQFTESNFDITRPPHSWEDVKDWNMFRGRGEHLSLTASPGQRVTTIGGSFVQPYTFGTDNNLVLSAQYSRAVLPDCNEWQWLVRPGLTRELSDHWSVGFGLTAEGTEIWDLSRHDVPDYNAAAGYTPGYGVWGQLGYSTTPDEIIVNRGVRAALLVEPMYEDTGFVRSVATASRFFPLYGEGLDAHVLEVSGQAGQIVGTAPFFDRFFCGGLGSVRGFDVWGISPLYNEAPIGGYYFASGTTEYSFPLFHLHDEVYFRGVLFVDAGDVETHLEDMGRIRVASGFGLRVVLPKFNRITAGVNFAWPLNSYHGDDTQVFTFFVGMGL